MTVSYSKEVDFPTRNLSFLPLFSKEEGRLPSSLHVIRQRGEIARSFEVRYLSLCRKSPVESTAKNWPAFEENEWERALKIRLCREEVPPRLPFPSLPFADLNLRTKRAQSKGGRAT